VALDGKIRRKVAWLYGQLVNGLDKRGDFAPPHVALSGSVSYSFSGNK
jgi:hypothetical protein